MTKTEKAIKKIKQDLNKHSLTYEGGEFDTIIWTNNCTIELFRDSITVNEVQVELENVIWEVLAVEQPEQVL